MMSITGLYQWRFIKVRVLLLTIPMTKLNKGSAEPSNDNRSIWQGWQVKYRTFLDDEYDETAIREVRKLLDAESAE